MVAYVLEVLKDIKALFELTIRAAMFLVATILNMKVTVLCLLKNILI